MKPIYSIIGLFAIGMMLLSSCKDDSPEVLTKAKLTGYIQKGPFLNGTSISVSELNKDLSQTGKVFNTQITDNQGTFDISNIQLTSPYIELKADGFYFNEVTGATSSSQLTLYALADVINNNTLNVNVLSTLEKARVENLIAGGLSFADAKKKALGEILAIFSISKSDIQSSELLDLNKSGDDNAILLAVSVILQGFRSEAELTELLANMSADISTDGKLDNQSLGSALLSHAKYLNTAKIRENLINRYTEIGAIVQIPEFEKYITQFIENSTFKSIDLIIYPEIIDGKLNILNENNSIFTADQNPEAYYMISANTIKGLSLMIKIEYIEGVIPVNGLWWLRMEAGTNWLFSQYDMDKNSQVFNVIESGKPSNQKIEFPFGQGLKFRVSYFENNDLVITRTRIITVN